MKSLKKRNVQQKLRSIQAKMAHTGQNRQSNHCHHQVSLVQNSQPESPAETVQCLVMAAVNVSSCDTTAASPTRFAGISTQTSPKECLAKLNANNSIQVNYANSLNAAPEQVRKHSVKQNPIQLPQPMPLTKQAVRNYGKPLLRQTRSQQWVH